MNENEGDGPSSDSDMPIHINSSGCVHVAQQSFDTPTIYLDHWALCEFADAAIEQDRLVELLHAQGGTLVLSHLNIAEFTRPSDGRHADSVERFLDRLMPNIYLTDLDLEKALAHEALHGIDDMRPSPDLPMLKFLAENAHLEGPTIKMAGFITLAHRFKTAMRPSFEAMINSIHRSIMAQRADPCAVKLARKSKPDHVRAKVSIVMGELMRDLIIDPKARVPRNDVVDLQHSIVPLLTCDFVLLDETWRQRTEALRRRAFQASVSIPIARCFSKAHDGLHRFLDALEDFRSEGL